MPITSWDTVPLTIPTTTPVVATAVTPFESTGTGGGSSSQPTVGQIFPKPQG